MPTHKTHYELLNLRTPTLTQSTSFTSVELKNAYHKALLKAHPDKLVDSSPSGLQNFEQSSRNSATIDEIKEAYQTLSDPHRKERYDIVIRMGIKVPTRIVDLDDLEYNENTGIWTYQCRCHQISNGFQITENDLENEIRVFECSGCSENVLVEYEIAPI